MEGYSLLNRQHKVRKVPLRIRNGKRMFKDLVETGLELSGSYCEDGKRSLMETGLDFSFRDRVSLYRPPAC